MQTHEFVESVQRGLPLPTAEKALVAQCSTPDDRAQRLIADERRRPAAEWPARKLRSYGAGF